MGRSQNSFIKRQKEKKRELRKKQKEERKRERQENKAKGTDLSDMLAFVDEDGNLTSEPPNSDKGAEEAEDSKED